MEVPEPNILSVTLTEKSLQQTKKTLSGLTMALTITLELPIMTLQTESEYS
ncbi:hypothetical protein D3C87_1918930 [compost metagenome]